MQALYLMMIRSDHYTQFNHNKFKLVAILQNDYHKQIIIEALKHSVDRSQVSIQQRSVLQGRK